MARVGRLAPVFATVFAVAMPSSVVASKRAGLTPAIVATAGDASIARDADPAEAVVLLGGVNESWLGLAAWVPVHVAARRQVFGYAYDQGKDDLETSARGLAEALDGLSARGVRRLHVTAYSMGGWVAKAALDGMAVDGAIAAFDSIELTTLATPWGGFHRANVVWRLRAVPTRSCARAFARAIGKPMGFEVGSRTPFVRARRAVLPRRVTFRVFEGAADEIATPRTAEERENYEAVVALATDRVTVPWARHADMRGPRFTGRMK
jgi:alpha/beta hydrolase family protein DUF900